MGEEEGGGVGVVGWVGGGEDGEGDGKGGLGGGLDGGGGLGCGAGLVLAVGELELEGRSFQSRTGALDMEGGGSYSRWKDCYDTSKSRRVLSFVLVTPAIPSESGAGLGDVLASAFRCKARRR